jgi:hypothetical protein
VWDESGEEKEWFQSNDATRVVLSVEVRVLIPQILDETFQVVHASVENLSLVNEYGVFPPQTHQDQSVNPEGIRQADSESDCHGKDAC